MKKIFISLLLAFSISLPFSSFSLKGMEDDSTHDPRKSFFKNTKDIPSDVWKCILPYLEIKNLKNISQVCQNLRRIAIKFYNNQSTSTSPIGNYFAMKYLKQESLKNKEEIQQSKTKIKKIEDNYSILSTQIGNLSRQHNQIAGRKSWNKPLRKIIKDTFMFHDQYDIYHPNTFDMALFSAATLHCLNLPLLRLPTAVAIILVNKDYSGNSLVVLNAITNLLTDFIRRIILPQLGFGSSILINGFSSTIDAILSLVPITVIALIFINIVLNITEHAPNCRERLKALLEVGGCFAIYAFISIYLLT